METTALTTSRPRDIFGNLIRAPKGAHVPYKRIKNILRKEYTPPQYIGQNVYIKPSYIVSLPEFDTPKRPRTFAFTQNMVNLKDNAHNGIISHKADKKLRSVINWLCLAAEPKRVFRKSTNSWFNFKINFITLTLPDTSTPVTDKVFKTQLLNPFLVYCRKYLGLRNYVWKLEFQKNGKLHLHLTADTFLHHAKIKTIWNKLLGHNGMLVDFYKKFGHAQPNSTDVHSVRKINNLAGYLCKYMGKQDNQLQRLRGRIWGCNYELSRSLDCKVFIDRDLCQTQMRSLMQNKIKYQPLTTTDKNTGEIRQRGEIFFPTARNWIDDIQGLIKNSFDEKINALRNIAHDGTFFKDLFVV